MPFIEHLMAAHRGSLQHVVLIGHGGLYRCMLPLVLENIDFGFAMQHPLGHTGYVEAEADGGKLVCIEWSGNKAGLK